MVRLQRMVTLQPGERIGRVVDAIRLGRMDVAPTKCPGGYAVVGSATKVEELRSGVTRYHHCYVGLSLGSSGLNLRLVLHGRMNKG